MAAMTAGETMFSLAMSSIFSRWRVSSRFMAAASSGSAFSTRPMVSIISLYILFTLLSDAKNQFARASAHSGPPVSMIPDIVDFFNSISHKPIRFDSFLFG